MVALNASLAQEWKTEPVGQQFNFKDEDVDWIGKPFSENGKKEAGMTSQQ